MANEKPTVAACTPAQAVELLREAGGATVEAAWIEADIRAGAPVNADGTLNLIVYAGWLLKQGE